MLSRVFGSRSCVQIGKKLGVYGSQRFFAEKPVPKEKASKKKVVDENKSVQKEKAPSKKEEEKPDFPEYPFIQSDYLSGIRNRDYVKTIPREKRVDLLSKKAGDIVVFDDTEFHHYFPHDFYQGFEKQYGLLQLNIIQMRQESIDLIRLLNRFQNGKSTDKYPFICLKGEQGSGKSMVLRSLYYYCRANDWITLYVPSAHNWTHAGNQIIEMTRREGGYFAQPEHCQKMLLDLHITSGHLMKNLPLKGEFDRSLFWAKSQFGQAIDSGKIKEMNLDQLVLYGVNSARDSYEVAAYVKKELELCEEYPVLIAIDDYNALYDYTGYEFRNEPVHARKLYLASLFRMFDESDYSIKQDKPHQELRERRNYTDLSQIPAEPIDTQMDVTKCTFKNALRNGLVIGAEEKRYDHFIKFDDVVSCGGHMREIQKVEFPVFNQLLEFYEKYGVINPTTPAQRQYMYAWGDGNYGEMIWALLMNRRWLLDYTPKDDFFEWLEQQDQTKKDTWTL